MNFIKIIPIISDDLMFSVFIFVMHPWFGKICLLTVALEARCPVEIYRVLLP